MEHEIFISYSRKNSMGKTDNIFPFIIGGVAMCKDSRNPLDCFPPALRNLPKDDERLGVDINENGHGSNILRTCSDCPIKEDPSKNNNQGDINEKGRDAAVVKIVGGMLDLSFDSLWQRRMITCGVPGCASSQDAIKVSVRNEDSGGPY